jgi:serine/threonine-protein kinase
MDQAAISPEPLVGGRYRILRLLGEGGMGVVYEVRDEATGQRLALKRIHGHISNRTLFEREYRTLASLHHPGIVKVFDYGVEEAGAFYTMELLEGTDLSNAAPMPWREVCGCLRECASILGVLHAHRLVHRDLNPRNIWRQRDGKLKLLDFARSLPSARLGNWWGCLRSSRPRRFAAECSTSAPICSR